MPCSRWSSASRSPTDASRGRLALPAPATPARVRLFGITLLPFAALLWLESGFPDATRPAVLSAGNAVTGAVPAAWLVASRRGLAPSGALVVGSTATVLVALAAAEAAVARDMPR